MLTNNLYIVKIGLKCTTVIDKNIQFSTNIISQEFLCMKQYPQTVDLLLLCHSSSGVDPIVSSHIQPCGHFTGCTKISLRNNKQGWKEETDKHGFRTANTGKGSGHISILVCIYVHGHHKNSVKVLHSYQKCWLICHCLHCSVLWLHVLESHSQLTTLESHS